MAKTGHIYSYDESQNAIFPSKVKSSTIPNEENDLIYNHEWIKAYCIAKTKEIWGSILGKYSQSLVGGAQINYGDIKSEAQSEIEKLEQELLDKWSDPVLPQVF